MTTQSFRNLIFQCIDQYMAGRYSEKHGLVTSYDSDNYLAKVKFQPFGQESDWLPIETGHIGNGYGMATGLVTGDGKATGDQVIVRYHGDDFESGKIVQRVHSKNDKPPKVESGETVMWTQWGQQLRFNKDGSITVKTGVPTQQDSQEQQQGGQQQVPNTSLHDNDQTGQQSQQQQQQQQKQQKKVTIKIDDQGNMSVDAENNITTTAKNDISTTASHDLTTAAKNNMTTQADNTHIVSGKQKLDLDSNASIVAQPPIELG